jgi:hypothetical protein
MTKFSSRQIPYNEFLSVVRSCVRTMSGRYRPLRDEHVEAYSTPFGDLLGPELFAPRFMGHDGYTLVEWDDSSARPVALTDFVGRSDFLEPLLKGWSGAIASAQLVLLACTTCGNKVLIDGFHRAAKLCRDQRYKVTVDVFELAGAAWPTNTPDISVICSCLNPSRR